MDSEGMLHLGGLEAAPGELSTPSLSSPSFLSPSFLFTSYSSVTHLVWVDGHAGGQPDHGDAVEARRVRDRRWSEVVIGLGRVTHQDGVDLQRRGGRALRHSDMRRNGSGTSSTSSIFFLSLFLSFFLQIWRPFRATISLFFMLRIAIESILEVWYCLLRMMVAPVTDALTVSHCPNYLEFKANGNLILCHARKHLF